MVSLAQIVPYISLTDQSFLVARLGSGGALPTSVTLTVTAAAAAAATSIQLQSSQAGTILKPGTAFSVLSGTRRVPVYINSTTDVTVGTTAAAVTVQPLKFAIASTSTAPWWIGLIPILGIDSFDFSPDNDTAEVTGTDTGSGKAYAKFRAGQTANITLHERPGDEGAAIVKYAVDRSEETIANRFIMSVRGDGELISGVALFSNGSRPGNKSTNAQLSFNMQFQGSTFSRLDAYNFAVS